MKRFFVVLFGMVGALAIFGFGTAQAQTPKLGYINTQRIMAEAPGTSEAQAAFEQDMQGFQAELSRLEAELDSLQQNYERQQATLSPAVRQERQQAIQESFMSYQQRQAQLEEQAQQRQNELVSPIMQRIAQVIDEIREQGGYAMIFDVSAGSVISADPSFDLTQQVLERLRTATP